MRLVILQPFYLPYAGVFELVRLADTFVIYDDVQFVKQNWQHRNRILTPNGPQWLTVPVRRNHGDPIIDVEVANDQGWQPKHWRSLEMAYGSAAPHGTWLLDALEPHYVGTDWEALVDLNLATFRTLCDRVGVETHFLRSSQLGIGGESSDRVLAHCRELGASHYLSGPAAREYLDEGSFDAAGVQLEYLAFDHPTYTQAHSSEFVPFLSVVDMLANVGPGAGDLLAGAGHPVVADQWAANSA